ncbi:YtrH family sporulation protein [Paenibacillus sp.]|uniref:YtrH family sporulation protein n=1 Tax=Paenibacillus sp. TaxID=58172 RepID=UPI002D658A5F|nr:YtrH family sporulation protein [Paenibacillus sp.]HZG58449.1 YtrH family sporulation protein [Paenibacillus sp.]
MSDFLSKAIQDFFVAFGVVFGASMLAGIASVVTMQPPGPSEVMKQLSENVKIWAVVVAIGGTIDPIRFIEHSVTEGYFSPAMKQILLILCAFLGAHSGTELIRWMVGPR